MIALDFLFFFYHCIFVTLSFVLTLTGLVVHVLHIINLNKAQCVPLFNLIYCGIIKIRGANFHGLLNFYKFVGTFVLFILLYLLKKIWLYNSNLFIHGRCLFVSERCPRIPRKLSYLEILWFHSIAFKLCCDWNGWVVRSPDIR